MKKRYRRIEAKRGELRAGYGRLERGDRPCVVYAWGPGTGKPDSRILCNALEENPVYGGKTLVQELEARGYDLDTLKFTIQMKQVQP